MDKKIFKIYAKILVIWTADYLLHIIKVTKKICMGIKQLFGHCIAAWYAIAQSLLKPMEIGPCCGCGWTVTQKAINSYLVELD